MTSTWLIIVLLVGSADLIPLDDPDSAKSQTSVWPKKKVNLSDSYLPAASQVILHVIDKVKLLPPPPKPTGVNKVNVTAEVTPSTPLETESTTKVKPSTPTKAEFTPEVTLSTPVNTKPTEQITPNTLSHNETSTEITLSIPIQTESTSELTPSITIETEATAQITFSTPSQNNSTEKITPNHTVSSSEPIPESINYTESPAVTTQGTTNHTEQHTRFGFEDYEESLLDYDKDPLWGSSRFTKRPTTKSRILITLIRLVNDLNSDAKRQGFTSIQGYSQTVLETLAKSSLQNTSKDQLRTLIQLMLQNNNIKTKHALRMTNNFLEILSRPGLMRNTLNRIPPLKYTLN